MADLRCELCGIDLSVRAEWKMVSAGFNEDGTARPKYAKRVRVKPLQAVLSFHLEGQWPRDEWDRTLGKRAQSPREPMRFCQPCFSTANSRFLEALSVAVVKRMERGEQ